MLLSYGMGKQKTSWHVLETKAPMYARVYYILGGDTHYRSGPCVQTLQKGWLYIFPVHAPYEMVTSPENTLECLYMHLDLQTAYLSHMVAVSPEVYPEIMHLVLVIRDAIEAGLPASYMELLSRSLESLCMFRNLLQTVDAETGHYLEAIRKTYRSNVPLESVAASLGYSTEYFIRTFRSRLGVSPHQYAISLRMSDAVRLLSRSASLEEIAQTVGYADGHSFANAFRRYYGISPGVYRETYADSV